MRVNLKEALPWFGLGLSTAAFALDLYLPLGAALGPCYVLAVLTTYSHPARYATLGMAALATLMILVAAFAALDRTVPLWVATLNRGVALAAIWATVAFLYRATSLRDMLRKLEIEAEAQRAWLAQTIASIGDGVIACDASANVEFMNSVAERLTGRNEREAVGRPVDDVLDLRKDETGERLANPVHAALQGHVVDLRENTRLYCRDGSYRYIDDSVAPIRTDTGNIRGAVMVFRDVSKKRQDEKQLELRLREVGHRIKNVFANVHAIMSLCSRSTETPGQLVTCVESRLESLMRSTDRLLQASGQGCSLREIVIDEVNTYLEQQHERLRLTGPDVMLQSRDSVSLAMIIHELATNASKHGSLASSDGRVTIECNRVGDDMITLDWSESNGPPAQAPQNLGMGAKLIDGLVMTQFSGTCERVYGETGFSCRLELKLTPAN